MAWMGAEGEKQQPGSCIELSARRLRIPIVAFNFLLIVGCIVTTVFDIVVVDLYWTVYAIYVPCSCALVLSIVAWLRESVQLRTGAAVLLGLLGVAGIVFVIGQFRPWSVVTSGLCVLSPILLILCALQTISAFALTHGVPQHA
eukprot:TRINITY_DN77155_c0_g1_i1.p1 TRINITY_DN77155_c0_g1~~TRINITY_DN77155_c0_g1_i1.p1  ORF type:complete len:144 (+),score=17.62 TRINITY_DN77155_c0_g1_i1:452-883(+)